jgi:fatty acid desaturase
MDKSKEIKVVPPKPTKKKGKAKPKHKEIYLHSLVALAALWLAIFVLVSIIQMPWYMRILALILGSFLVFDIHHSIKHYVKSRGQSSN